MSKSSKFTQAKTDGAIYAGGRTEREINGIPYVPTIGVGMTRAEYHPLVDIMEVVWTRIAEVFRDSNGTFARMQWKDGESGEIFEEVRLIRTPGGKAIFYTDDGLRAKKKPLIKIEPSSGGDVA